MRNWKVLVGLWLCLGSVATAFAQVNVALLRDSLHAASSADSIRLYNELSMAYRTLDPDTGLMHAQQALSISNRIESATGKAQSYFAIAVSYKQLGKIEVAVQNQQQSISQSRSVGDSIGVAKSQRSLGEMFIRTGKYEHALPVLLAARDRFVEAGDKPQEASVTITLGMLYDFQEDYGLALDHYRKALAMYRGLNNKEGMSKALNNIGVVYDIQGEYEQAIEYYYQSLVIDTELNDKEGIAGSLINIGLIRQEQGEFDKAEGQYKQAYELYLSIGSMQGEMVATNNLADLYRVQEKYALAIESMKRSLELSKAMGDLQQQSDNHSILALIYRDQGNFEAAFESTLLHQELRDSLFSLRKAEQLADVKERYENEKNQAEIKRLQAESALDEERNRTIYFGLGGGILLVLLGAILLYSRYRIKQRANQKLSRLNAELAQRNEEVTDSLMYAQRIQSAMLPSQETLSKAFPEHCLFYQPRDIVGGDFFWVHTTKGGESVIAVADCTGHGVPGALVSMIGTLLLNEIVVEGGERNPGSILDKLRDGVVRSLHQSGTIGETADGMDISLCCINADKSLLLFAGAHNNAMVVRNKTMIELSADRQPVGYTSRNRRGFSVQEMELQRGDVLYLSTDGYPDQFGGPKGKKLKSKAFKAFLVELAPIPMSEQADRCFEHFINWRGIIDQIDDVCVLGVKV